ncbi:MAG: universal stress protein [Solirubrobacteraceae bacterium]|jgi:nucleotide-binding universal stress UspA family protein
MSNTQTALSPSHGSRQTGAGSPTPVSTPAPAGTQTHMPVFTNILCAVDGTRGSLAAVRMAASLAGPDGHLTLLVVTAVKGSGQYAMAAISPSRVKQVLERAKRVADAAGVACTTVVDPHSPPERVILERASQHDLLAIGAPTTSWLGGMLIGSVAATALSRFTTPMLVVRRPPALRAHRLLVASDGEQDSDQIVQLAGRLGQNLRAQVRLVNALVAESKMNPHVIQTQASTLKRMLADACEEPYIEPGKAWDVVLRAATSTKADMIVMGSRRLGGVRAFGSVSRRVVHDAPCSVLLVPPK